MAYGEKYSIPFLNRELTSCEIKISAKDYVGDSTTLPQGSAKVFELSYQAQDNVIPYGLRPSEAVIEFYSNNIVTLIDFYSEDDNFWKVQFYKNSVLEWTGFLQLDNCSESFTDIDHIISLNANDGLAKLQNLYMLVQQDDPTQPLYVNWILQDLFSYIFAFIGSSLDTATYLNIFENTTDDRADDLTNDLIQQTAITTAYYINDDGTTLSLYDILNNILTDLRSCMFQAKGEWVINRWGDMRLFEDGTMPGTKYLGGWGSFELTYYPASINIGRNLSVIPINENQRTSILRPFNFVKETFNYNHPPFIVQTNLQLPPGATPFDTTTIGNFVYSDYLLATYFPGWTQINDDASYLEVVVDTTKDFETDRYIVTPCCSTQLASVRFNAFPVSEGDQFDFSLQYRTDSDTDDPLKFWIRFLLVQTDGDYRGLTSHDISGNLFLTWSGAFSSGDINNDSAGQISKDIDGGDFDTTQWFSWALSDFVNGNNTIPFIPADGMLYIQVMGTNGDTGTNTQGTFWKDIKLDFTQFINSSTQITGQTHTNTLDNEAKNNEQFEVTHDDSPRNSITGTLFTNDITTFPDDIGGVFFTKTSLWHRSTVIEAKKLGELNTENDLFIQQKVRTIMEGDFFGLTDVSMASIVKFVDLDSEKNFIFGVGRFDYMSCIWNATFYELFDDDEHDFEFENILDFNETNDSYTGSGVTIPIHFANEVVNIGFTPNGGFTEFTYNGSDGLVQFDFSAEGYWRTAADATMNLNINGISIGSYHVGVGSAFYFFRAGIQISGNIVNGDVLSVTLDWSGSISYTLDLDDNAIRVNVEVPESVGDYQFNYIYQ